MIAENTPLILPLHQDLDRMREEAAGAAKIGTTGRGIGPAYEDKVGRRSVRVADLGDEATLDTRLDRLLAHHDALRAGLGAAPIDRAALKARLVEVAPQVLPYAAPVWRVLDEKRREGRRILFEGAQGALLDIDFGTYPYVTSSNTLAGMAATGTGMGPGAVDFVLGDRQGLHHAGRRGAVPGGARRRDGAAARRARAASSAPSPGASGAAAGSTRCWCGRPARRAASTASR